MNLNLPDQTTIQGKISTFTLIYIIAITYIILKTSIFNYDEAKLHPSTVEEAKQIGTYSLDLVTCNANPGRLLPITGCISYPPEKWLWRIVTAYNSGFIFYELGRYVEPEDGKFLLVLKIQQFCLYLITFSFDLPIPMINYLKDWETDFLTRLTWYIHIPTVLIFGFTFVVKMFMQKDWKLFGVWNFFLIVGYVCWCAGNGDFGELVPCFQYSFTIFAIIEYFLCYAMIWYIHRFLMSVTEGARLREGKVGEVEKSGDVDVSNRSEKQVFVKRVEGESED